MAIKKRSSTVSELTETQAKVFEFFKESFHSTGSMPTFREVAKYMGWKAVGTAQDVIGALIEKGYLERDAHKARGLRLKQTLDQRFIPILGSAPAGHPVESFQNHDGDISVPSFIRGPVFAVRVRGDSMIQAGLEDGDIAIVRQVQRATHNEIIVAMIEGEVTIKRLQEKGSELWLKPENDKYKPRRIEDPNFRVLGKVIGIHRYWE